MNQEQATDVNTRRKEAMDISSIQPCVLLVEDDRSVRRYLEVTLQRSGYKVITASDGLEAMKVALSSQVDVVITDAIMPHMSGQELARFLRSNPKFSRVPIVLLTGQANQEADSATEKLVDGCLYKPVKADDLKNCLAELLRQD
ncbi:MAG: response regulator [Pyrinomonadaceae bacterium]